MKRTTDNYLKGRSFTRSHGGGDDDRWVVTDVYFDVGMREAHAVLVSIDGEQVELPVSHLKEPWWEPLY
jgi:hypothetical protein